MLSLFKSSLQSTKEQQGVLITLLLVFTFCLAAALQIQGDIYGLRLNLADLALPIIGVFILTSLALQKSSWPQWGIPYAYLWLAALVIWMAMAFVSGYWRMGEVSSWALYNKLAGVVVLIAYFALGGWLARNAGKSVYSFFMVGFLSSFLIVFSVAFILIVLKGVGIHEIPRIFPFEGLMGNRNAYSLLMVCSLVFLCVIARRVPDRVPVWILPLVFLMLPIVAVYNGSRAGWVLLALFVTFSFVAHFKWSLRHILLWLMGGALLAGLFYSFTDQHVMKRKQVVRIHKTVAVLQERGADVLQNIDKQDSHTRKIASELIRLRNAKDALALWRENPVIGAGLGSILHYQHQNYDPQQTYIDVMDSTPIWLLAETGIVGLVLFVGFYFCVMRVLWSKAREQDNMAALFAEALFVFLLLFGLMSLFHEVMYTRYLWVMMGMGVALRAKQSSAATN